MAAHLTFKERDEFKRRLKTSLREVGINPNSPTQLFRAFKSASQGWEVSQTSVYKWLEGESLPDSRNMEIVANICNVCPHWLRTGQFKESTLPSSGADGVVVQAAG